MSPKEVKEKDNFLNFLPDNLLEDKEFLEVWLDWIEYRTEIKHPLTKIAAKRQIKLLSKFSPSASTAMVDQSINRGWRGIFQLDRNHELLRGEVELVDPGSVDQNNLRPL